MKTLTVAAAADQHYALPLAVMLRSAANALDPESQIEAYVVDDGLNDEARERVTASVPANIILHWIKRPAGEFAGLPNWGRMTLTTYHKLKLGEWLPRKLEKVIWLDCDTLVLQDLTLLWETMFDNHVALAAQDAVVPSVSSRFGVAGYRDLDLEPQTKYFNAGVMLIDLSRWRAEVVADRALGYLKAYGKRVVFWDQEALNAALAGKWKTLDPRWNWNPVVDSLTNKNPAASPPWIVHFSGNLKPWHYRGANPSHAFYHEVLDQTAWRGWRPTESWRRRCLARYESSPLRARLYPLEQIHLRLVRWRSRHD